MTAPVRPRAGCAAPWAGPLDAVTALAGGLRAPLFAATAVGVSVLGHVVAGGALPGGTALGLLLGVVGFGFCAIVRRELSTLALLVGLGAVETFMHLALTLTAPSQGMHHGGSWSAMLAAHVVADLAATGWLRAGEATAGRLLRHRLPQLLRTVGTVPAVPARRLPVVAARPTHRPRLLLVLDVDPRRGPPLPA